MEKQSKNQSSNISDSGNTEIEGYGMIRKTVKGHKTGVGYVYLPAEWIGHDITIISLTPFLYPHPSDMEKTDEK